MLCVLLAVLRTFEHTFVPNNYYCLQYVSILPFVNTLLTNQARNFIIDLTIRISISRIQLLCSHTSHFIKETQMVSLSEQTINFDNNFEQNKHENNGVCIFFYPCEYKWHCTTFTHKIKYHVYFKSHIFPINILTLFFIQSINWYSSKCIGFFYFIFWYWCGEKIVWI